MTAIRQIQKDLDEQKVTILKTGENVTEKVTENINNILEEKFKTLEAKYENLNGRVENQEKRLYYLEKEARQRNIVIFGMEDNEKSYSDLENNIMLFIGKYFSIKLDCRDIQAARRLGKKGERPRPVTVTFTTLGRKIEIFKQKRMLNDSPYYIKEDYPQNILEIRKQLQEQAIAEREKGNRVIIKYDKLIILPHTHEPDTIVGHKKRTLPISPENNIIMDRSVHTNKKNKVLPAHSKAQRSSSISEGILKPGMLNFLVTKNTNSTKNLQENTVKNT